MDYEKMAIIDLALGKKLAGNDKTVALDILNMFITTLPAEAKEINIAYQANNLIELQKQIHKIRGGVAYCGLPRFKTFLIELETALKHNVPNQLPSLLEKFNAEVALLLTTYANFTSSSEEKKTAN